MTMTPTTKTNEFLSTTPSAPEAGGIAIASSRQAAEVQAAMVVAKRFPRDEIAALSAIKRACARPKLAEGATYAFKRGSSVVDGPSIRLAEAIAQSWGNLEFGFREAERKSGAICGESLVEAFAWDIQSNTRRTVSFTVRHWRDTQQGGYALKDERDIYELVANQAARRVRACILAVVPGDVVDEALETCEQTIKNVNGGKPLADRVRDMVIAFDKLGVTSEMIAARLQHPVAITNEPELIQLGKIYTSIKDGISKREEFFTVTVAQKKDPAPTIDVQTEPVAGRADPVGDLIMAMSDNEITAKQALATLIHLKHIDSSVKKLDGVPKAVANRVLDNLEAFVKEAQTH